MTDKIYLSGPIEHSSNPKRWRTDIMEATTYGNVEFLCPYTEDVMATFSYLNDADGVLVHYEHETPTYRVPMEIIVASQQDKPVVVWTDRYNGPVENTPSFLQHFVDDFQDNGRPAVNSILNLM